MQGCSQGWENRLKDLVVTFGSAIGECGLDFAVKGVDRKAQERVFAAQLNIAHDLKRPVSVHCRHAWDCCIGLIKDLGGLPAGGVVHSFSGSAETASVLEGLGLRISFSGTVTNPRSVRVHAAAEAVSDECLLIETDSPDLIPYAIQNLESDAVNEPANLVAVVRSLALVRGRSEEEIAELTYRNGTALFTPA
jgi:TatD DNase family protein